MPEFQRSRPHTRIPAGTNVVAVLEFLVQDDGLAQQTQAILNYLFGAAVPPACLDAADAVDSGRLDITDPIRILGFLFLGGAPPPKPGPFDPGTDPTEDRLSCLE